MRLHLDQNGLDTHRQSACCLHKELNAKLGLVLYFALCCIVIIWGWRFMVPFTDQETGVMGVLNLYGGFAIIAYLPLAILLCLWHVNLLPYIASELSSVRRIVFVIWTGLCIPVYWPVFDGLFDTGALCLCGVIALIQVCVNWFPISRVAIKPCKKDFDRCLVHRVLFYVALCVVLQPVFVLVIGFPAAALIVLLMVLQIAIHYYKFHILPIAI